MTAVVVAVCAFVLMEPVAALAHRRVMHGAGWGWHRSHHAPPKAGAERNDLFPLVIGAATIVVMAVGSAVAALRPLLWIGCGATAYGVAYVVVHDLLVHQRLGRLPLAGSRYIRWVGAAHARHHRYGAEPFGFLLPVGGRTSGDGDSGAEGRLARPIRPRAATRTLRDVGTRARDANTS